MFNTRNTPESEGAVTTAIRHALEACGIATDRQRRMFITAIIGEAHAGSFSSVEEVHRWVVDHTMDLAEEGQKEDARQYLRSRGYRVEPPAPPLKEVSFHLTLTVEDPQNRLQAGDTRDAGFVGGLTGLIRTLSPNDFHIVGSDWHPAPPATWGPGSYVIRAVQE